MNDRVKQFLRDIERNQYAVDAWGLVIREIQGKRIEDVRPVYENAIAVFPTAGRFWKLYIEHEIRARNNDFAEMLFQRCLMKVLNFDLWKAYLAYVRDTKRDLPSYNEKMAQAYDFALEKIGCDVNSYSVWSDYIDFLDSVEAVGHHAELQKIAAIRNVFHRGLIIPMLGIETLWEKYVAYEQRVNLPDSPTYIEQMHIGYTNTKRVSRELESVVRGLNKGALSVPPTGTPAEITQVELWKRYLAWEKGNPTGLNLETHFAYHKKRVMFAFEQALLCLSHHADIWIDAIQFLEKSLVKAEEEKNEPLVKQCYEEVLGFYQRAIKGPLRKHTLIHFAFADFHERRGELEKAAAVYEAFVSSQDVDPTSAYVHYMAFARRTEGTKAARIVFRKARENPRSKFHVFIAAALMEYLCSRDKNVAFKIFELGLKKYSSMPEYVLAYVDYLSHLNEDNNIRVLFERVLSSCNVHPEKLLEIWDRYLDFEANHGDLASILKVEKRRALVVARVCRSFEGKESLLTIDRYKFFDLMPIPRVQLLALGYHELTREWLRGGTKLHEEVAAAAAAAAAAAKRRNERTYDLVGGEEDDDSQEPHVGLGVGGMAAVKWKNLPPDPFNGVYALPDVFQMLPFVPKLRWCPGKLSIAGGDFPYPPGGVAFLRSLPPPTSFRGPFVHLESFMEFMVSVKIPGHGKYPDKEERDAQNRVIINGMVVRGGHKADDDALPKKPEIVDIYTKRQKLRTLRGRGPPPQTVLL